MSRIAPVSLEDHLELQPIFEAGEKIMGFIPNDGLIMAHAPEVLRSFLSLVQSIYAPGEVSEELKRFVGLIASSAAGCQYCQAHAAHAANDQGKNMEKIRSVWEFRTSSLFSEAEKSALEVAYKSSLSPSEVSDDDFAELKKHFSDKQIIEIISVISMYGFLNRWNGTLQTTLEDKPKQLFDQVKPEK